MSCGMGMQGKKICPFSFGLALGITSAIAMYVWAWWAMQSGASSDEMAKQMSMLMPLTMAHVSIMAGWALIKGFLFGFVWAGLYNLFKCCKAMCSKGSCGCGNPSCGCKQ